MLRLLALPIGLVVQRHVMVTLDEQRISCQDPLQIRLRVIKHAKRLKDESAVHVVLSDLLGSHLRHDREAHLDGKSEES